MYQIYVFPSCEKCHKATEQFKIRNIGYEEINVASLDGRNKLREILKSYGNRIAREEGWLVLPLIIKQNDGSLEIYQGENGLEKVLRENENSKEFS